MSFTAGEMSSWWWLDEATRAGSGRRDERRRSEEGVALTMAVVDGQLDERLQ
jgi:hypothetical protein